MYPADKMYVIDSIKSYQWIAVNNQYDQYIFEGDSLFLIEDLSKSKGKFISALTTLPEKRYPQQMINRIDSIMQYNAKKEKEKLAAQHQEHRADLG